MIKQFLLALMIPVCASAQQAHEWGLSISGRPAALASLTDTVGMSANSEWSLALRSDGTILTWGSNQHGQQVHPAGQFVSASAGWWHGIAARPDGSVVEWGTGATWATPGLSGAVQVAAGDLHSAARMADGTVRMWGTRTLVTQWDGLITDAVDIASGWYHLVIRHANGTVTTLGQNGQTGMNIEVPANVASRTDIARIGAGQFSCYAITSGGDLFGWGMPNTYGQFSFDIHDAVAAAGGYRHTLVLHTDGHLSAYGDNTWGQCSVPIGTFAAVSAGRWHSQAIEGDVAQTPPAPQLQFFVEFAGDDILGDGTSSNPFATIQHGLDAATAPGSSVVVGPGLYSEPIIVTDPITISK